MYTKYEIKMIDGSYEYEEANTFKSTELCITFIRDGNAVSHYVIRNVLYVKKLEE